MSIKKVVVATVKTDKDINNIMQTTNEVSRNSCLDACTCTGNCE